MGPPWSRRVWLLVGAGMVLLCGYSLWASVPERRTVELDRDAASALQAGRHRAAERGFSAVLSREPRAVDAWAALACIHWITGRRSRALIELTRALDHGLFPGRSGTCPGGLPLDEIFIPARLDSYTLFAAPRPAQRLPRYEALLTDGPPPTAAGEAKRLLIGACLAFRSGLDGAGWYYAANAAERGYQGTWAGSVVARCAGNATMRRLGCAGKPDLDCVLSDRIRATYFEEDSPYY